MKEITEKEYKKIHSENDMSVMSSFSDPNGTLLFGRGIPYMETDWKSSDGKINVRCAIEIEDWDCKYYIL